MAQINGYKEELQDELQKTDPNSHTSRLLAQEIERVEKGDDRKGNRSVAFIDVHPDQPQNVGLKIRIPIQEFPRVNFVGKLLGPKGSTLKGLQEETGCKMAVLGRGSMRDKAKEEELRKEGGKKYGHLNDELHVNVEVFAEMTEAYRRLSHAVAELKKFLVPENSDDIRQQQMQEMMYSSPGESRGGRGGYRGGPTGRGGPPMGRGAPGRGSASAPVRGGSGRGAPLISQAPAPPMRGRGAAPPTARGRGAAPLRGRGGAAPPQSSGYDDYGYSNSGHGDGYDDGYSSRGYGESGYTEDQGDSQYYGATSRGQTSSGGYDDGYSSYDYGYSWGSEGGGYGPVRSSGQGGGASKPRSHPYGGGY